MTHYEAVIGLETHIQLNTKAKIFCTCSTDSWEADPNTNICPVCTGLPGVLPVLNEAVVEKAVLLAAAIQADIQTPSFFDRKNYFYPDLPKGYQISQYDMPLAKGGYIEIPIPPTHDPHGKGYLCKVRIHKLHIEEDAGKTKNIAGKRYVDFNRCGVPLVEMVTEPDLHTADEAAQYLIRLRQLLRWLDISEGDMEKGNLRCDANVSIREKGSQALNVKTEIKNVNSIENVRDAINKEIGRQIREVEQGGRVRAWTLKWDDETGVLRKMRSKETEADYRYFHEPDLLPLEINAEWKKRILEGLPELPLARRMRFMQKYNILEYDADILTGERSLADYFEDTVDVYQGDPKQVSNWIINDILRMLNDLGIIAGDLKISPQYLAQLIQLVDKGTINTSTGKNLLIKVQESGRSPNDLVQVLGLTQVSDDVVIRKVCQEVISQNPDEVALYQGGKQGLIGWFIGQAMQRTQGKADPKLTKQIFEELLAKNK